MRFNTTDRSSFLRPYLPLSVNRFLRELLSQVEELYQRRGITVPAAASSTLHWLSLNDGATTAEIGGALSCSHQLVTQHINKLSKLGIVEKHSDPSDARSQTLHLTQFGEQQAELLKQTMAEAQAVYDAFFDEVGCHISELMERSLDALQKAPLTIRFADMPQGRSDRSEQNRTVRQNA